MQFQVVAIGQRMPAWVQQGWDEYARRFPKPFALTLREIPLKKRARNSDLDRFKVEEGEALLQAVPAGHRAVALDERGKQHSTVELARMMEGWMQTEHGISFLIGGPEGLSPECRNAADQTWSLSRLTLPHPLVRVVLAEQLYRAWTVTQNHPYHRI